jgi:hypothetical protein
VEQTITPDALSTVRLLLVFIMGAAALLLALDNWPSLDDGRHRLEKDHMLGSHRQTRAPGCPRCYP